MWIAGPETSNNSRYASNGPFRNIFDSHEINHAENNCFWRFYKEPSFFLILSGALFKAFCSLFWSGLLRMPQMCGRQGTEYILKYSPKHSFCPRYYGYFGTLRILFYAMTLKNVSLKSLRYRQGCWTIGNSRQEVPGSITGTEKTTFRLAKDLVTFLTFTT